MRHVTRSALAFLAGRIMLDEEFHTIFDQKRRRHLRFLGPCQPGQIRIHGLDDKVEIVCEQRGAGLLLFQHTLGHHIDFEIEGNRFQGFDEESEAHFRGDLKGRSLVFFDYHDSSYSRFMV